MNLSLRSFKKVTSLLVLVFGLLSFQSHSQAIISFPVDPEPVTVCNTASLLTVQVDFDGSSSGASEALVTIQLAQNMEYVSGSVLKISGAPGLSISEDGGTPNTPIFRISGSIATSDRIIFTIARGGNCEARASSLANTTFQSSATVEVNGLVSFPRVSPSYIVDFPVLSFSQPVAQNSAVINTQYTRTFEITNGADGCADAVYFSIDRTNASTELVSLTLGGNPISPTSKVGDIEYYTIDGALLTADEQLCNGETLVFTETYILRNCLGGSATHYAVGWGCDASPVNWCDTSTGVGPLPRLWVCQSLKTTILPMKKLVMLICALLLPYDQHTETLEVEILQQVGFTI